MKIRDGFVSNSSSSSFVILGIDDEEKSLLAFRALMELSEEERKGYSVLFQNGLGEESLWPDYHDDPPVIPEVTIVDAGDGYFEDDDPPTITGFGVALMVDVEYGGTTRFPKSKMNLAYDRLSKFNIDPEEVKMIFVTMGDN